MLYDFHNHFHLQAKSGLIMEDDARAVAKMLKNSILTLTKEREERKHLEREVDFVPGMLIPCVNITRQVRLCNIN